VKFSCVCYFFFLDDFYFFHFSWFRVLCQFSPDSKVTQSYKHIYTPFLTLSSIILHHKWLDMVPCAMEQDLIAYPFQRQYSASINPRLTVRPTPSPSSLANHKSVLQVHEFLFCGEIHLCHIFNSRFKLYHMEFVFLFLTYFTYYESLAPSMLLQMTLFCPFDGWVVFHCVCIPHLLNPFICQRMFRLFPWLAIVNSAAMNMRVHVYFSRNVFSD